ncbi:hypothetical protein PGQ11_010708 [Apiospora arundinis]|uniref:Uncharacterized protein n=1 Tax=Apiospora arundinis TaxID=335852 RepID=A0ABR2IAG1_9PEZI
MLCSKSSVIIPQSSTLVSVCKAVDQGSLVLQSQETAGAGFHKANERRRVQAMLGVLVYFDLIQAGKSVTAGVACVWLSMGETVLTMYQD